MEIKSDKEKEQSHGMHDGEIDDNKNNKNNKKLEQEPQAKTTAVCGGYGAEGPRTPMVCKKGAWSKAEDEMLRNAVEQYGSHNWVAVERYSGLARQAKNCRLRWLNYLRPNLKKCPFTQEEEKKIFYFHAKYGNSWCRIAAKLPGRSDNEIKNFWYKKNRNKAKKQIIQPPSRKEDEQSIPDPPSNENPETDSDEGYFTSSISTPTNDHPCSIIQHSSQLHTPNATPNSSTLSYYTPVDPSISSPSTVISISTPQSQLHSSPTTLSTPLELLNIQTPTPNNTTPTSHPQNFLLSAHQSTSLTPGKATRVPLPSPQQIGTDYSEFQIHRKPPLLTTPQDRFKRVLRAKEKPSPPLNIIQSCSDLSFSSGNAPSVQKIHYQPAMESPGSPLKLQVSPSVPVLFSVQNPPTADTQVSTTSQNPEKLAASLSAFQLKSPARTPLSPLKSCVSNPVPSDSGIPSKPDSTVQFNSSTASAFTPSSSPEGASLPSPQLKPSSSNFVLLPTQTMPFDTNNNISLNSSFTFKAESPSIQIYASPDPGANNCFQEAEAQTDLEMQDALREAEAKVRFLKKKLRQSRNQKNSPNESSRAKSFHIGNVEATNSTGGDLTGEVQLNSNSSQSNTTSSSRKKKLLNDSLRVNAPSKNSKMKDMQKRSSRREVEHTGALPVKVEGQENFSTFPEGESSESGSYTQGDSDEIEEPAQGVDSGKQILVDGNVQEADESWGQSLKRIASMTFREQGHSIDSFDHIDLKQIMNSNLDSRGGIPCQVSAGKYLNECSKIVDLLNESSTHLQDNFLMEDLLGQTSGVEGLLASHGRTHQTDSFGPIYGQSTTTTQVQSGDEANQLNCQGSSNHFGQEFFPGPPGNFGQQEDSMSGNQAKTSRLDVEGMLLQHQHPATNPTDSGYMMKEFGCNMEEEYFIQMSHNGSLAGTFSSYGSSLQSGQYPMSNLRQFDYPALKNECSGGGEYSVQTSSGKFYQDMLQSSNTWKKDATGEQSLNQGFLVDSFGVQGLSSSEEHKLLGDRCQSAGLCTIQSLETMNSSCQPGHGTIAGILEHQLHSDDMDAMHEELSSMLEFFPSNIPTPEWYSNGNFNSGIDISNEPDMDINLHMSLTSTTPITIADYI